MTYPTGIPPVHVSDVIDATVGADSIVRLSIDAGKLPCEDTFLACPRCERQWVGDPPRAIVRPNVKMHFSRYGWAIAHPLRPGVVSEHVQFGLWVGECRKCGTVFFGERRLES